MRSEDLRDERLELLELLVTNVPALLLRQRLLKGSALVHRGRRDNAAVVGDRFHACKLAWCHLHGVLRPVVTSDDAPGILSLAERRLVYIMSSRDSSKSHSKPTFYYGKSNSSMAVAASACLTISSTSRLPPPP